MFRTSAFKKIGGYNENLVAGEDHEIFRRISKIGQTHFEKSLLVYHTGRRAHKIGWPKLLLTWLKNSIWVPIFGKASSKEWEEIR